VKSGSLNSEFGTEGKGQKKTRSEGPSMWHEGASCWHVREMLYTFAGYLQAKGLFGVHLGPPNLALMNSHHPHPMASSCMRVCYCRHLRLKPLFSSPLPTPHPPPHPQPKRAVFFFLFPPICAVAKLAIILFYFYFLILFQTSLGRFRQISPGWWHYFKKLLKLEPVDINVATPSQIVF
jgi:hypothetical protein